MKLLNYIAGALLPALAFTSCLSNDDNARNEATYNFTGQSCFNYVYDEETEEAAIFDGSSFKMKYDYTNSTVDIDITGLKVSDDLAQIALRLPTLRFVINSNKGFFETSERNVTPTNAVNGNYHFDYFSLQSNPDRAIYIGNQAGLFPLYLFNFELNGRYKVTTFPIQNVYIGTTASTPMDVENATQFNYKGNLYAVNIDYKKLTATISVHNSIFGENMPAQSFSVKDLPIKIHDTGFTIATEEGVTYPVYSASGKLMENCYMSDVAATTILSTGNTSIHFTLDLSGLGSTGYSYGKYKVLNYVSYYGASNSTTGGNQ